MNTTECVADVRIAARLDDADDDYTSARIRTELTQTLHQVFGNAIIEARDGTGARTGFWLKQQITTTTADVTHYRMPYRSLAGVCEAISLADIIAASYQLFGDQVVFATAPTAGSQLIFDYYLRPSTLVQEQTAGRVISVSTSARTITVNSAPTDRVTGSTVLTGDRFDVIHPNGWHELSVVNATATLAGSTFTFAAGTDLSDVEVGDYLREAEQTDWPCLPDDFHHALCVMTGARILRSRGHLQKAEKLEGDVAADMQRFADLIEPRIKDGRNVIVPTVGVLRGRPSPRWPRTAV